MNLKIISEYGPELYELIMETYGKFYWK